MKATWPGKSSPPSANINALLEKAGMDRKNIVGLRIYTTDVDAFLANYGVYSDWIAPAGIKPPQTLLGISKLAMPGLMVEIEIEAAA